MSSKPIRAVVNRDLVLAGLNCVTKRHRKGVRVVEVEDPFYGQVGPMHGADVLIVGMARHVRRWGPVGEQEQSAGDLAKVVQLAFDLGDVPPKKTAKVVQEWAAKFVTAPLGDIEAFGGMKCREQAALQLADGRMWLVLDPPDDLFDVEDEDGPVAL